MKAHLVTSENFLRPGGTLITVCGQVIRNSELLNSWDNIDVGGKLNLEGISAIGTCKACLSKDLGRDWQYLYCARNGND